MGKFLEYIQDERQDANIERVNSKLGHKISKGLVNQDTIQNTEAKEFAKQVVKKRTFFEKCKDAQTAKLQEQLSEDPFYAFIRQCQQRYSPVTSLLTKIDDGVLNLKGYSLNMNLVTAFKEACIQFP